MTSALPSFRSRLSSRYCILNVLKKTAAMKAKPKYLARIENIYFLARLGSSLRWATEHIVREEMPEDVRRALGQLDRIEASKHDRRRRAEHPD